MISGAPKPQTIMSYWPALMDKAQVHPRIALFAAEDLEGITDIKEFFTGKGAVPTDPIQVAERATDTVQNTLAMSHRVEAVRLYEICLARSGDKGDMANIGILARSPKAFAFIKEELTAQRLKNFFQELCHGRVERYVLEGLSGLNFLLDRSLGGGGSSTLRTDAQGKTFAQALLRQKLVIPPEVLREVQALRSNTGVV